MRPTFLLTAPFLLLAVPSLRAETANLRLTLPPVVYATPGVAMNVYHDNVVLTQTPKEYRFEFDCRIGASEADRWTVTPGDADVGEHPLALTVKDGSGKVVAQGRTTVRVTPKNAGEGKELRLLIVGDSLTSATEYSNEIARLLDRPGNPKWTMFGTHKPAPALPPVRHEGYGGWRWIDFLSRFNPPTPAAAAGPVARKSTSPFVFPSADGKTGTFDLQRYFREHCDGQAPTVVTFLLGINDCFAAKPSDPDAKIDEVLGNAEKLLAAFHQAAPQARLAVGLVTPPNSRQEAFEANYKDRYTRWGWKQIQHRLVERMLERLSNREREGIHLVPTELNLDPVSGYPVNNGVHPNKQGYQQIGASFYSWIKAHL